MTSLEPALERALDLAGVFAFALSGAQLAVQRRFDVVGITALAVAAALGGGMTRDVLLGDVPPVALEDQTYLVVPLLATLLVLVGHRWLERLDRPVLVFDAGGLALFSVVGSAKALDHGLGAVSAVLLGVLTAVGGGVIRDLLAQRVPCVFTPDSALYAIPAGLGAVAVTVLWPAARSTPRRPPRSWPGSSVCACCRCGSGGERRRPAPEGPGDGAGRFGQRVKGSASAKRVLIVKPWASIQSAAAHRSLTELAGIGSAVVRASGGATYS